MMRVTLVSCHEYGLAVLAGVHAAGSDETTLHHVVTTGPDLGRELVGSRYADFTGECPHLDGITHVQDLTLADLLTSQIGRDALSVDLVLVAGWPRLISKAVLDWVAASDTRVIGFHPSRLPRGRGVDPVAWTILAHQADAGVSAFLMTPEADSGDIVAQERIELAESDSAGVLYAQLLLGHLRAASAVVSSIATGELRRSAQRASDVTIWPRIEPRGRLVSPLDEPLTAKRRVLAFGAPYGWARDADEPTRRVLAWGDAGPIVEVGDPPEPDSKCYNVGVMGDAIMSNSLQIDEPDGQYIRRYSGAVIDDGIGSIYLQRRDDKPGIVNPGMVTLFGGVAESHESPEETLHRELEEELGLVIGAGDSRLLGYVDKVEKDATVTRCAIFQITAPGVGDSTVSEGQGFAVGSVDELLASPLISMVARISLEAMKAGSE